MKKSIIAASAASLAVAALPIAGVFAATSTQFSDTLTVGVAGGCTIEDNASGATPGTYADRTFSKPITAGTAAELEGAQGQSTDGFKVSCNTDTGTWTVSVAAENSGNLVSEDDDTIAPLASGASMGGNTSSWAIQSHAQVTSTGTVTNPYEEYTGYSAGVFLSAPAGSTATFNPSYKAYVAPNQAPGNYAGKVTYTIAVQ